MSAYCFYPTKHLCIEFYATPELVIELTLDPTCFEFGVLGFGFAVYRCWCANHAMCK